MEEGLILSTYNLQSRNYFTGHGPVLAPGSRAALPAAAAAESSAEAQACPSPQGHPLEALTVGQPAPARPPSCAGHTPRQPTAAAARRGQRAPGHQGNAVASRARASSPRGPPRASGGGRGPPPAPCAITVLRGGPARACPGRSGAEARLLRLLSATTHSPGPSACPPGSTAARTAGAGSAITRPREGAAARGAAGSGARQRRGRAHGACAAAAGGAGGVQAAAAMARRLLRGLLLLEAAGLLGALLLYRAMERSQDFRYTMQKRFPSILEVYYKSNEWSGIHGIRENDQMTWLSSKN
ncbi:protein CEBPZOS [Falco cherrug]|uniref:protein CEBPZOS n=1 Tax=Falco cherrug TaxID=345164 RepID=UPI00247AE168|nr:protein CEBPZOS [Falco cherrug]